MEISSRIDIDITAAPRPLTSKRRRDDDSLADCRFHGRREGARDPVMVSRLRFDLPDALWQDRRERRGAFIRAVPRPEPEPGRAMTENGFDVIYDLPHGLC